MTRQTTRRAFLHSIGGASLIGLPSHRSDQDNTADDGGMVTAADLVIPPTAVPPEFEQQPDPASAPFIDALDQSSFDTAGADIATRGYWKGAVQTDPEWVLASMAIVTDDPFPRPVIETAAQQSYDKYVTAYDAETSALIDFEQAHTTSDTTSEWCVDIHQAGMFDDTTKHIYTDVMRHQYVDNTVLATIVFGPTNTGPPIDSLLDQYAALQRTRYDTHGAAP